MDRVDWYFRQLVNEGEMDLAFDQVQDRIEQAASQTETGFDGMIAGGTIAEAAVPDLTVDVAGNAYGYTPEGKRLQWDDLENIDVSEDDFGVPTVVSTPGNMRWISVFVEFDEAFDDLRTDGFGAPVYWKRLGSHRIFVIMSDEDVAPPRPDLRPDALLLADIRREYGWTVVQNSHISVTRREDFFRQEGGYRADIVQGRIRDVASDLLTEFNDFVEDLEDFSVYPAGASLVGVAAFSDSPTGGDILGWPATKVEVALRNIVTQLTDPEGAARIGIDPYSWIGSGNAQDAFEEVVNDLANTASASTSGANRVGLFEITSGPPGGSNIFIDSDHLQENMESFVGQLTSAAFGSPGANRIGADARGGGVISMPSPATLAQGSVRSQLKELLDYVETIRNTPYAASAVSFSPHDYVTSTNVQAAITELIDDLQSQGGGPGTGSDEIGYFGTTGLTVSDAAPVYNTSSGTLKATIDFLLGEINKRAALSGGQTFDADTNPLYFGDTDFALEMISGTGDPKITFHTDDFFFYDRSENKYRWYIANGLRADLSIEGLAIPTHASGLDVGTDPTVYGVPEDYVIRLGGTAGYQPIRFFNNSGDLIVRAGTVAGFVRMALLVSDDSISWAFDGADRMRLDGVAYALHPQTTDELDLGTLAKRWNLIRAQRLNPRQTLGIPSSQEDVASRHQNNGVVAWCHVTGATGALQTPHWNVQSVTRSGLGSYTVYLDGYGAGGEGAISINCAAIATANNITADRGAQAKIYDTLSVDVQTRDLNTGALTDTDFSLVVIGRPNDPNF